MANTETYSTGVFIKLKPSEKRLMQRAAAEKGEPFTTSIRKRELARARRILKKAGR